MGGLSLLDPKTQGSSLVSCISCGNASLQVHPHLATGCMRAPLANGTTHLSPPLAGGPPWRDPIRNSEHYCRGHRARPSSQRDTGGTTQKRHWAEPTPSTFEGEESKGSFDALGLASSMTMVWLIMLRRVNNWRRLEHEHLYTKSRHDQKDSSRYLQMMQHLLLVAGGVTVSKHA